MEIQEFNDGYCLTHNSKDYLYKGKSEDVINMISEKVKELLKRDLELLKQKIMQENNILI